MSQNRIEESPLIETYGDHRKGINCVTVSDDASLIVTGGDDTTARMWTTHGPETHCLGVLK